MKLFRSTSSILFASLLTLTPWAASADPVSDPVPYVVNFTAYGTATSLNNASMAALSTSEAVVAGQNNGSEALRVTVVNGSQEKTSTLKPTTSGRTMTAANPFGEVWVADSATLFRRDGSSWRALALPYWLGRSPAISAIEPAAERGRLYVAVSTSSGSASKSSVRLYAVERGYWRAVGDAVKPKPEALQVQIGSIRVASGRIFAIATHSDNKAGPRSRTFLMELSNGRWKDLGFLTETNMMHSDTLNGWVTDGTSHLYVGTSTGEVGPFRTGFCRVKTADKVESCGRQDSGNLSAAALIGDGRVLLGGAPGSQPSSRGSGFEPTEARTLVCASMAGDCAPTLGLSVHEPVQALSVAGPPEGRVAFALVNGQVFRAKI